MDQIATFHTHFGALSFHRRLAALGDAPVMMPVPRRLSASCGTCVRFTLPFSEEIMADEDLPPSLSGRRVNPRSGLERPVPIGFRPLQGAA